MKQLRGFALVAFVFLVTLLLPVVIGACLGMVGQMEVAFWLTSIYYQIVSVPFSIIFDDAGRALENPGLLSLVFWGTVAVVSSFVLNEKDWWIRSLGILMCMAFSLLSLFFVVSALGYRVFVDST